MTDKKESKKADLKKAEYPLNTLGMGYRSTIESGPYLFTDVEYTEPEDNYRYQFCGACPFFLSDGNCVVLQRDVHILGSCKLYLPMEYELALRHEAYMRRYFALQEMVETSKSDDLEIKSDDLEIKQEIDKYIEEKDGKFCVISHQTGKNFGCYSSKAEAEKRLEQIKRFKKDIVVKLAGTDEDQRLVYGIVLEPDEVDSQDDTVTAKEIEKAAHNYAMTPMVIGDSHVKEAAAKPVETFIYNPEILKEVKPGSWLIAVKVQDDELWKMIKAGEMTGFSIGALAKRNPVNIEEQ